MNYKNIMELLTKAQNLQYAPAGKVTTKERQKAEKLFYKLLGNYKLTKKEILFLNTTK